MAFCSTVSICSPHEDVNWVEVDLRWGITSEEAAEGKVIRLVLEEVRRCKPFFIGILGERYGWVPDSLPVELIEIYPWIRGFPNASVNELEIIQGVLSDPQMLGYGLMYFRDPHFTEQLPATVRPNFESESASSRSKLELLKQRIRNAADEEVCLLRENYSNPEELCRWILDDFGRLLNTFLPDSEVVDPLNQEAKRHEAYAQSLRRVYIGRPESFSRLDVHGDGNGDKPLVISGETGSGKSALVANWVAHYRQMHPDAFVLEHYIGATPDSTDCAMMLRRIIAEFKRRFDLTGEIAHKPDVLCSSFPNWLHMAASKGRVILVLDELNHLEDRDSTPNLLWLPTDTPSNLRIFVSMPPSRSLDAVSQRGWEMLCVGSLTPTERERLIVSYMQIFGKRLDAHRLARLAHAPASANPLFLKLLLDELRQFGQFDQLDERFQYYLSALNLSELYERIFQRWEQDYDPDLVRQSLTLIWASRAGVSEIELLDLLGRYDKPLPRAAWRSFQLTAESVFISRSGHLSFANICAREAVGHRYLSTPEARRAVHRKLEEYFKKQQTSGRNLDELKWQRQQLE